MLEAGQRLLCSSEGVAGRLAQGGGVGDVGSRGDSTCGWLR